MFSLNHRGSFDNLESFLKKADAGLDVTSQLHILAQEGVWALMASTPLDSGWTAHAWGYEIESKGTSTIIAWTNDSSNQGFHIAVGIHYGYGTGTGGYVYGRDYINPAIRPIFDRIIDAVWKVVTSA
jgi:hypothetical protein